MRDQLVDLYRRYLGDASKIAHSDLQSLSPPLLVSPSANWTSSSRRMLLVGQETFGWSFYKEDNKTPYYTERWSFSPMRNMADFCVAEDAVEAMMAAYEFFSFSEFQPGNRNSPLWRFYRDLRAMVGDEAFGFNTSVIWTNLWRQDFDGGSVANAPKQLAEQLSELNRTILRDEIQLLKPTDVVFCTGPLYDQELSQQFPSLKYEKASDGIPERALAKLVHPDLPTSSWRTYHPNYMQRQRQDLWALQLNLLR